MALEVFQPKYVGVDLSTESWSGAKQLIRGENKNLRMEMKNLRMVLFIQRQPFQQIHPNVHIHFAYFSSNATNGK